MQLCVYESVAVLMLGISSQSLVDLHESIVWLRFSNDSKRVQLVSTPVVR